MQMTHDGLIEKVKEVFQGAGQHIESIEMRKDRDDGVDVDLLTTPGKLGYRDSFNLDVPFDGQIYWWDFTHKTSIGHSKDSVEKLSQHLKRLFDAAQPELMDTVDDLNKLL